MADILTGEGNVMAYENGIITTAGGETYDVSEVVEPLAIKVEDATEGNFCRA